MPPERIVGGQSFTLAPYIARLPQVEVIPASGRVVRTVGLLIESTGPQVSVGSMCEVMIDGGSQRLPVQIVGFREGVVLGIPLGETAGVKPGDRVVARTDRLAVPVGRGLLGRVVDALGRRIAGKGPIAVDDSYPLHPPSLNPMGRGPIDSPLGTGVRAMDAMLTCGRGQRIGLFGGSGVGKSTL